MISWYSIIFLSQLHMVCSTIHQLLLPGQSPHISSGTTVHTDHNRCCYHTPLAAISSHMQLHATQKYTGEM